MKREFALLMAAPLLSGCITLSRTEVQVNKELERNDIDTTELEIKDPATAGVLNVLPGFGNFYLASGTSEGVQWAYGFGNLLFWPLSVLWGVPQAIQDAEAINDRAIADYYLFDPMGQAELARIRAKHSPELAAAAAPIAAVPAAVAAAPVAPAMPVVPVEAAAPAQMATTETPASGGLAKGSLVATRDGAKLRMRAAPDSDAMLVLTAGEPVTLGTPMSNGNGKWWYAEAQGRKGWIAESELDATQ